LPTAHAIGGQSKALKMWIST